ncbi:glutathione S-transferase, amine-terminal domain protein (macronuclear) [Tetrahymena thermophila SB210]|uniref:glutathione transferase n=1 Tax=Tetrahymena thermophila (strain SB210) TaxID=312017 RepID=Q22N87_TETTS|nr:glutathione S-transferase, amine-terminal domain protein [Tetrahymena thermophila SB210]EAR86898.1 glutathione S-transferase, amine-terminal domain protein [Tetrahymena thermophila SB210]|eukprot:XP_001007143.1 glutathione S-transferase, amine-terminal domain protein [Tetrahymena thermophila SB210]
MDSSNTTNQIGKKQTNESKELIIGYLENASRGQTVRYILDLVGYPYAEHKYTSSSTEWEKKKSELGLDFPNLPYLIHGDFSISESQNIVNYLIELTNQQYLYGEGKEKYRVDNIRFVCDDLFSKIYQASKQNEDGKNMLNSQVIPKIQQLQKALGNKPQFFESLTIADLYAYITLKNFKTGCSNAYIEFASTFDPFLKRLEEILSKKNQYKNK